MKKVVVFGASGRIGAYLTDYLCENANNEFEVVAVGKRKTDFFNGLGVKYYSVDICDKKSFKQLPTDQIYAVINLAAAVATRTDSYDVNRFVETNVIGAVNVLEYARNVCADRFLYTQTYNDVFGAKDYGLIIKSEQHRKINYTGEFALYALTKNFAVDLANYYQYSYGMKSFVFRLPNIYMFTSNPYYLRGGEKRMKPFHKMIQLAQEGKTIEVWGNPDHQMDMVYVKDCCQMLYKALLADIDGGFYNVGTGIGTTLQEQAEGIIQVFSPAEKGSEIRYCPEKPNGTPFIMDISNAISDLGYYPEYNFISLLEDFKVEMKEKRFTCLEQ